MYEQIIEETAKEIWVRVFAANEKIIDKKQEISRIEFLINKDYELSGVQHTRTKKSAIKMTEYLRDLLYNEKGLKIIINKNIKETTTHNKLYQFQLLIMKRTIGE